MPIHILSDTINKGNLVSNYLRNRWPLTYDANDIISATNLTNNGTVTFSSQGASFNGSNQWLNGAITLPTVGAISFWMKPREYGPDNNIGWMNTASPYAITGVWISTTYIRIGYLDDTGSGTTVTTSAYNTINFPLTNFIHLVLTWDISYGYLYKNGIGYSTYTTKGTGTTHSNFSIGRLGAFAHNYFNGFIQDCRIYSGTTPTLEMVKNIYLAGPNMIYQSPKIQNRIISYRR